MIFSWNLYLYCANLRRIDRSALVTPALVCHSAYTCMPETLQTIKEVATIGGARVLGMADRIGSIIPGKEADIILVDIQKPHVTPPFTALFRTSSMRPAGPTW